MYNQLNHDLHVLENDRAFKVIITTLCMGSLLMGSLYPFLTVHNNVLVFVTNMLWLWEPSKW